VSRGCAPEQIYCEITNLLLLYVMRVRGKARPRSSASIAVSSLHTRQNAALFHPCPHLVRPTRPICNHHPIVAKLSRSVGSPPCITLAVPSAKTGRACGSKGNSSCWPRSARTRADGRTAPQGAIWAPPCTRCTWFAHRWSIRAPRRAHGR